MKLYRHYKNKFYKYLGEVKHSETEEELVLYETRYESPSGRTWVRPKALFFGELTVNGVTRRRFEKVAVEIEARTQVGEGEIARLAPLVQSSFGHWDEKAFRQRCAGHKKVLLLLASVEGKCVGFKLGYELDQHCFYSWLGAVDAEFRDVGLASRLMLDQHAWCRAAGYKRIRTKTQNHFRPMLLLNIRSGFDIIGTENSEHGLKVIMEKSLNVSV
jgi:hypothetical protein